MRYEELPPEQRPIAGKEDVLDVSREIFLDSDTPVERAARKYLRSRRRRQDIEFELGRGDAFLQRMVELFRARRFAKLAKIQIEDRKAVDEMLPTLARYTIDEPDTGEIH